MRIDYAGDSEACALRAVPIKCRGSGSCFHHLKPVIQGLSFFMYMSGGICKICLMKPESGFDVEGIWLATGCGVSLKQKIETLLKNQKN